MCDKHLLIFLAAIYISLKNIQKKIRKIALKISSKMLSVVDESFLNNDNDSNNFTSYIGYKR